MKIAVTGATGFIGNALVKRLLNASIEVVAVVRADTDISRLPEGTATLIDSGDTAELIASFRQADINGIIHLASLFLAQHSVKDIEALILSNVLFGTRLLEASVQNDVKWFINTGTFWQHFDNAEYDPVNLYAATKQAFEDIAKYYYETKNIDFVTLKLNDTFGPDDTRAKVFTLWEKIAKSGESLDMSAGEQIIDISYIDNVIDAYMQTIRLLANDDSHALRGKSFSVGAKERMSLRQLAEVFEEATDTKLNINWGSRPYREREVMSPWDRGNSVPGWEQRISLTEGIREIIKKGNR